MFITPSSRGEAQAVCSARLVSRLKHVHVIGLAGLCWSNMDWLRFLSHLIPAAGLLRCVHLYFVCVCVCVWSFRPQVGNVSSKFYPHVSTIRREGSYLYEVRPRVAMGSWTLATNPLPSVPRRLASLHLTSLHLTSLHLASPRFALVRPASSPTLLVFPF